MQASKGGVRSLRIPEEGLKIMVSVEHVESEDGDGVRGALELVADDACLGLAHIHFSTYCYQYESIILGTKKKSKRKSQKNSCKKPFDFLQLFASSSFSRLGHRFSVIVTALHAHVMRELRLMTLRARYIVRCFELPVGTATVATCLRGLSLWYCHVGYTSLIVLEQAL